MRDRKGITRQTPTGEKYDYDSENSWISEEGGGKVGSGK